VCIVIFVVSLLTPFISRKFYDSFAKTRQDLVNKAFDTKCPIKEVIQYLGQKSTEPKYSTNIAALLGALKEYLSDKNKGDFTKEGLEKFLRTKMDGLSLEMKDSVISFMLRIIVLTDDVRFRDDLVKLAVADFAGEPPKGYEFPTKMYWFFQVLLLGLLLLGGLWWGYWWNIGALILGNALGIAIYKYSNVENRVQFWGILLICFFTACGVQFIDGQLSVRQHLKEGRFPFVASLEIAGEPQLKFGEDPNKLVPSFIGCFKGNYIFETLGGFGWENLTIVNESRIREMKLFYLRWVDARILKSGKELQHIRKHIDELNKEGDELKKQLKRIKNPQDPNEAARDMLQHR
jgi:hypothetical protein